MRSMDRTTYYRLRHHVRASGFHANRGQAMTHTHCFTPDNTLLRSGAYVTDQTPPDLTLVLRTMLHPHDDGEFEPVTRLADFWERVKDERRPRIYWQNIIRSNVRHDNRVFTEYLTHY